MAARLRTAEADVNAALRNLDLTGLTWTPVDPERWKQAEARLIAAKKELAFLLADAGGWMRLPDASAE